MKTLLSSLVLALLAISASGSEAEARGKAPWLGVSFPPMTTADERDFTIKHLRQLKLRHVRFTEEWATRETNPGKCNWKPLDDRFEWVATNGLDAMLTIGDSVPAHAGSSFLTDADPEAFRRWISDLLRRYQNRISKIQFGNEWDGTMTNDAVAARHVLFNNIVWAAAREISPTTLVVLGGITTKSSLYAEALQRPSALDNLLRKAPLQFNPKFDATAVSEDIQRGARRFRAGGLDGRIRDVVRDSRCDLVDIHLYDLPEFWPEAIRSMRAMTDKGILVSEFGVPHPLYEMYSERYHAVRLETALNVLQQMPVLEIYHFRLVDGDSFHGDNGLLTRKLIKKPAYDVMFRAGSTDHP